MLGLHEQATIFLKTNFLFTHFLTHFLFTHLFIVCACVCECLCMCVSGCVHATIPVWRSETTFKEFSSLFLPFWAQVIILVAGIFTTWAIWLIIPKTLTSFFCFLRLMSTEWEWWRWTVGPRVNTLAPELRTTLQPITMDSDPSCGDLIQIQLHSHSAKHFYL